MTIISTILLLFNSVVLTKMNHEFKYGLGQIPIKPFNCFTCLNFWTTTTLSLLVYFNLLNFDTLILITISTTGYLIGSWVEENYF